MGKNVLVVDDDEIVIRSCEAVLGGEGFTVTGVTSSKEAMSLINDHAYDLVITDLIMPTIDGFELIKWINENHQQTRVMAMTGYSSKAVLRDAIALDIIDFLPKPFFPHTLTAAVNKAISTPLKAPAAVSDKEEAETYDKAKFQAILKRYRKVPGALIVVLQETQELIGYLPASVQKVIAKSLKIPVSEVHAVVSFYSYFTMKPMGKYNVRVCLGTACYVKRADEILEKLQETMGVNEGEITQDGMFSLETVRCIGACGLAPVVLVGQDTFGSVNPATANEILKEYQ
ncbi:MAG: NAD(P)H-dependent oxidoreductase subunit E [Candidatus Magnetominusculus sp. LBB02]|nr:NAD(P)H-dependent oxidoreductase subunit E [Candidatus Magnetominusculus sp. LBB02]